ncbi:hypothetical protein RvY_06068-2 [Ramazzottius varieornatus]|uniref:Torsin-1A-interacting protein 1/2 AAA+ activator domain-containing protein n=1 Tax=Ramazzottius varieornatus TaxID=947166 RepID=A0A1D1UXA8_RAMVA|nr:hypothetical protein RvY_06068-2 [Ramazzottius varieornatus]
MPLGRKSLGDYARMTEKESTSSSTTQDRGDRRLNDSPGKYNRLYPELDDENFDEDSHFKQDNQYEEGDYELQDIRRAGSSSASPKAPPRQRKGNVSSREDREMEEQIIRQNRLNEKREKQAGGNFTSTDSASQFDRSTQPRQTGQAPASSLTNTVGVLVLGLIGLLTAFYLARYYMTPVSNDQLKLRDFQNKFNILSEDFSKEVHDDSMERLYGALEHHVQNTLSRKQDKGNNYPTCILLAADAHNKKTLDCLADRIAQLVPPKQQGKATDKNIYVVDLSDKKVNHKNPDEEDLRSRVHHGINQGLNEGANVIVFKHIEVLVPSDIPLLELFYSYCDGDNPTFPKTLWVLTLATKNLQALQEAEITRDKEVAKALRLNVEKYLENIIESRPGNAHEQPGYVEKHARNALLTRIANYIVPVLKTSRTGHCSVLA